MFRERKCGDGSRWRRELAGAETAASPALAILLGWAVLFAVSYLIAPGVHWLGLLLGANWAPTAGFGLECAGLGAAGWAVGRVHRSFGRDDAGPAVLVFALMLAVRNFGLAADINIPWLVRLARDATGSSRYWESFGMTLSRQALLFGRIFVGAGLARSPQQPLSIGAGGLRR